MPDSGAYATAHNLPIELVRRILEHVAQQSLEVSMEPCVAARLQLLSRSVRLWLMPMIYYVFVVRWPDHSSTSHTPTQVFFFKLLTEHDTLFPVRTSIKHLVFLGESGPEVDRSITTSQLEEWCVESVCLAKEHQMQFLHETNIVSRSVFLTRPPWGFNILVHHQHTRSRLEPGPNTFGRCTLRKLEVVEFACSVKPMAQVDGIDSSTPGFDPLRDYVLGHSVKVKVRAMQTLAARRYRPDGTLPANPPLVARLYLSLYSKANVGGTIRLLNALMVVQRLSVQLVMATDSDEELSIVRGLQDALNTEGDPVRSRVTVVPVKKCEMVGDGEDLVRLLRGREQRLATKRSLTST